MGTSVKLKEPELCSEETERPQHVECGNYSEAPDPEMQK